MTGERLQPQRLFYRRIVVKIGSNVLTGGEEGLHTPTIAAIATQVAGLVHRGAQVALVTSGAVAAGRHRLREIEALRDDATKLATRDVQSRQVAAAVGQSRLMALWDALFAEAGVAVGQALLTRHDLADRLGYLNARNTLLAMLDLGVVPVINENDVVSVEELQDARIGDNDNLSAQVANLVDADLLLLLTDIGGLYTTDPRRDPDARLIERVERIDEAIEVAAAGGGAGARGTGGMTTKVQAARIATGSGTHVVIADGRSRDIVLRAAAGEPVGTHFLPVGDRIESRRRYLLSGLQARGRVVVDAGAAGALLRGGNSLLPAGVLRCEGVFQRGDVVQVMTAEGRHLASGTANYSSDEVARIAGKQSGQIADLLGYEFGSEVIHRNNLVLV